MANDTLPREWQWRTLGELGSYINGAAFKPAQWSSKGVPIIRIQNLTNPATPFNYYEGVLPDKFRVKDGDLLISWSATIDVYEWNRGPAWLNQHIFRVEINEKLVDKRFLALAVKHALIELRQQAHGLTMQHIKRDPFERTQVAVPPFGEQRRIIARIEALTARIEQARGIHRKAVDEATSHPASLYHSMYERLMNEYKSVPLSEAGQAMGGGTPSKQNAEFWKGNIPWIAPKYMKRWRIEDSPDRISKMALESSSARLIPAPAVLFVVRGMILARKIPVAISSRPLAINQDMKAIVPRDDIDAVFLASMMRGTEAILLGRVEVAGHGTRKLRTERWGSLPIPVPPMSIQEEVVRTLEAMHAKAQRLMELQADIDAELASFMPALLAKAFRGEL